VGKNRKDAHVEIPFQHAVSIPGDVLIREVGGEAVLLNLNSETYFGLDEVGTRMWQALTSASSIQHAYEQLLAEYDVDPDTLRSDLITLITDLVGHGLLELHEA